MAETSTTRLLDRSIPHTCAKGGGVGITQGPCLLSRPVDSKLPTEPHHQPGLRGCCVRLVRSTLLCRLRCVCAAGAASSGYLQEAHPVEVRPVLLCCLR